jgi:hypothetical protein
MSVRRIQGRFYVLRKEDELQLIPQFENFSEVIPMIDEKLKKDNIICNEKLVNLINEGLNGAPFQMFAKEIAGGINEYSLDRTSKNGDLKFQIY